MRRSGHDVLALGVHRDNPARRLYETAGFALTGEDGEYLLFRRGVAQPASAPRSASQSGSGSRARGNRRSSSA